MYLRTVKRKNRDGSTVAYYQLAHNERHPVTKKPIAKIIHSFGRADELDRDALVRLCKSIARVCGLTVIDPMADDEQAAETLGLPEGLKLKRTVSLGPAVVIEALWGKLGIKQSLRDIIRKKRLHVNYERALLAMCANRLCRPASKLGVWERWLSTVYLPDCQGIKLEQMYEAMDLLYDHKDTVEKDVFYQTANLFNLTVDIVFYDTTTASFSIDGEDEMRRFGHSKEGTWAPQVVVALAVTREGLPVRCWVFPGNTSDVDTVKTVRAGLRGWKLGRVLFVADAGMNSEDNRKELARACGKYLLATRMASVSVIRDQVLSKRGRYTVFADNLHAKEVVIGNGARQRRYILCYNPKEAERQQKHRQEVVTYLEQELSRHRDKSATARWAIDLLAAKRCRRYLSVSKSGRIRIDRAKIRNAARFDGKWVIETNDDTINLEDAACGYKGLMVIERCFRSLKKTQIKMMPMYHWAPRRVETHIRICVLSLLIERAAELTCGRPWHRILRDLETLQVSEFENSQYRFLYRNEATPAARKILKSLKIKTPKQILNLEKLP